MLPGYAGHACLDAVMEQVESGPGVTAAAANAWAKGDTPDALVNDRTYERCFYQAPGARAFEARTKVDIVAAIEQALTKPGHSVAVVWLPPLLAQGGEYAALWRRQTRAEGRETTPRLPETV